jgi:excisionase family DNA binding protein
MSQSTIARRTLSRPEAANYLGVSETTLYRLSSLGRLPFVRIGTRRLVYRLEDLDGYLRSNLQQGKAA